MDVYNSFSCSNFVVQQNFQAYNYVSNYHSSISRGYAFKRRLFLCLQSFVAVPAGSILYFSCNK